MGPLRRRKAILLWHTLQRQTWGSHASGLKCWAIGVEGLAFYCRRDGEGRRHTACIGGPESLITLKFSCSCKARKGPLRVLSPRRKQRAWAAASLDWGTVTLARTVVTRVTLRVTIMLVGAGTTEACFADAGAPMGWC